MKTWLHSGGISFKKKFPSLLGGEGGCENCFDFGRRWLTLVGRVTGILGNLGVPLYDFVNSADFLFVMLWALGHGRGNRKVADAGELSGWWFNSFSITFLNYENLCIFQLFLA